jgi:hypothetical protein
VGNGRRKREKKLEEEERGDEAWKRGRGEMVEGKKEKGERMKREETRRRMEGEEQE